MGSSWVRGLASSLLCAPEGEGVDGDAAARADPNTTQHGHVHTPLGHLQAGQGATQFAKALVRDHGKGGEPGRARAAGRPDKTVRPSRSSGGTEVRAASSGAATQTRRCGLVCAAAAGCRRPARTAREPGNDQSEFNQYHQCIKAPQIEYKPARTTDRPICALRGDGGLDFRQGAARRPAVRLDGAAMARGGSARSDGLRRGGARRGGRRRRGRGGAGARAHGVRSLHRRRGARGAVGGHTLQAGARRRSASIALLGRAATARFPRCSRRLCPGPLHGACACASHFAAPALN
jgi:hypothetical protein